jgi:alcohol dehydrogenase class IV
MEMLPTIAEGSAASSLMKVNPRQAGAKEIEDFLRMAWDGIR